MSTKKRIAILATGYCAITMLYISIVALGSKSIFSDPIYVRLYLYSIIFPLYCGVCGLITRFVSCRPIGVVSSFALLNAQLITTLYSFKWIYDLDYGIANLGISYVLMCGAFFAIPFVLCHLAIVLIDWLKARKIVYRIAGTSHYQKSIDNPRTMKVYNKKRNRYERYLVWMSKAGKYRASERIIYFDRVELIAVDIDHNVYNFLKKPKKISLKEYVSDTPLDIDMPQIQNN